MIKPVLLAAAAVPPWPITNGYAIRVYYLLRELADQWRIVLLAPGTVLPASMAGLLADYIPTTVGGRWASLPSQYNTGPLERAARQAIDLWKPEAAVLWHGTEFLGFARNFPPTVSDRIDCMTLAEWRSWHHARTMRQRITMLNTVRLTASYERHVVRASDATVVVGDDDARALRRIGGRRTVHVIPNGVAAPPAAGNGEGKAPMVAFTGVLDFQPNVDAACHFAHTVWPEVHAAVPEARFVIAGRHPLPEVRALAQESGIEVRADVPDMYDVLQEAWVAVAPMVCGAGIKNKVLEAWAAARPVAMTALATNGLALTPDARELVAEDSQRLGALVIDLLRQPERRHRLGKALRNQVLHSHRWASAAAALSELLKRSAAAAH